MTRQDLVGEFGDVLFDLVPAARNANDPVSREDVESLRRTLVAICDRVAMRVAMDNEFTPEDAADAALDLEQEREMGLD
jgi:hypothetical protein